MRLQITTKYLISKAVALAVLCSFLFSNAAFAAAVSNEENVSLSLSTLTTDLTQLGRTGRLRENPNFLNETESLMEVLEKGGSQPVIVDQKGESSDIIVEQLAIR